MNPDDFPIETNALCEVCRVFGERQWCLATSGNFSARVGDKHCVITQSGKEKSRLSPDDLMICDLDGAPVDRKLKPSNETPLHSCLYKLDPGIGAVLHTHSASATVLSRAAGAECVCNTAPIPGSSLYRQLCSGVSLDGLSLRSTGAPSRSQIIKSSGDKRDFSLPDCVITQCLSPTRAEKLPLVARHH